MAKLIEFCGAPGVGKSTVYQAVSSRWKETCDWMPAHKAYPRKKISHPVKKLLSSVLNEKNTLDEKAMRKAGSRFIALYPEFIDGCWRHLEKKEKVSINKTDQRFEKAVHVFKTIQKIQVCRESLAAKAIVIEEGLVNGIGNALHRSNEHTGIKEEMQAVYNNLPLPEGLVFFEAEPEAILKRLNGRKRFVPSLENLQQNDLLNAINDHTYLRKTAVGIYEEKGLPVLRVNAADPVANNAERILEFLKTFN